MLHMGSGGGVGPLVAGAVAVVAVTLLWAALVRVLWRPYAVARAFERQGVRGPPYRPFVGTIKEVKAMRAATSGVTLDLGSHDFIPRVMPHFRAWMSIYGKVFLSWYAWAPALCVGNYDMVKQILSDRAGLYGKPNPGPAFLALMGKGIIFSDGEDWARRHRVVHPAFAAEKLKTMTGAMGMCAGEAIRVWEARAASGEVTVEVGQKFKELTANVILRSAFGSSYRQGKEVFLAQRELQFMVSTSINNVPIPGMQYVPTKANVRRWQLERKVRDKLMAIIDERLAAASETSGYGSDLLGLMLQVNAAGNDDGKRVMSMDEIIDECKTFFFAGHESTSHLLTWAMFLLGTHPEWQRRLREEVLRECGDEPINAHTLNNLKLVTMVLHETLRLYGAATFVVRQAKADADLCGVKVPKATILFIPIAMLHRDEEVWGMDAGEFNPLRFQDGAGRAILTFSAGQRSCIGQGFAILEAKITLALILRRFAFEVAPEYIHAPIDIVTLQPSQGLPVVLKLLDP